MRHIRSWTVLSVVLAAGPGLAQSGTGERGIVLALTLPNGATPQVTIVEGGMASVELPRVGKFGFVPTLKDGDAHVVIVELFDLNRAPHRRLTRTEAIAGGDEVQTGTDPQFGVRVARV